MMRILPSEEGSLVELLFRPSGVGGVYAHTEIFDRVIKGLERLIDLYRQDGAEILRFPPLMNRIQLERSGYLQSFPHLLGCVSCLHGDESHVRSVVERADWVDDLSATDLVLAPAACYPVYPLAAARGPIPTSGLLFDVAAQCFRNEATLELGRFQSFQMREYVCIGTSAEALDFRAHWIERGAEIADKLGIEHQLAPASDPFFGRAGRLAALSQIEQSLKFELLVLIKGEKRPIACMSFNYHRDHFGTAWDLKSSAGEVAHSACAAFGMERLALALFSAHGIDLRFWPHTVRSNLNL
jgi:seryl-tRNA synthetase